MGMRCNTFGFWFRIYVCFISVWGISECLSLNDEGLALLEFRQRISSDPRVALENWNSNDCDPCNWFGVHCIDGKVQTLDLNGLSLEGTLAPELGKLSHLKSLVLCNNNFSGEIPKELGELAELELLDLRENNLSGCIPVELSKMLSLKHLLLCDNNIEESDSHQDQGNFRLFSKSLLDECSSPLATLFACINRKFGHCVWHSNIKQWNKPDSLIIPIKVALLKCLDVFSLPLFKQVHEEKNFDLQRRANEPEIAMSVPNLISYGRRRLLEHSSNLAAAPYKGEIPKGFSQTPISISSGSFPASPNARKNRTQSRTPPLPPPSDSLPNDGHHSSLPKMDIHESVWKYILIVIGIVVIVVLIVVLLCLWKKPAAKIIKPWNTGISGQLQKAFITGVPKLNRVELETACEDFSNIVISFEACTIFKGTLSSGVEIAVVSTLVDSRKEWTKNMELNYRKKIATLSRINHKNFINLIGYCEEEDPFTRMFIFEYAPNGSLFEYLHVKDVERLEWSERIRIIMGTAYCLSYMHGLNPPVSHTKVASNLIMLSDDYAAKLAEITFRTIVDSPRTTRGDSSKKAEMQRAAFDTNVYDFGILLLEIISGKLPHSEEQGNLVNWASEYLNDRRSISYMIDPSLQSFKDSELDVICEVIQGCIQPEPKLRPTMKDITSKLREVVNVTPEQASPRLSPLWWAELEILSVEAT
ncbi:protein MALE DISCOVERER 2-like [Vicia villosa]|uniref:protein MALE DISCOVERER 2-like n=1 Tax=Vicia villosa TaxID=3911 RepID=UPI00273ABC62|nr:protein MALE DISCOVERER 2-like [Vicia villosa]